MTLRLRPLAAMAAAMLIMASCDRTPDYVIKPDDMVDLLTDIHKGESVVEVNRGAYRTDSLKKVLKQSVLMKHGVTQEQLDTSLVWYGHNIEKYIEVYTQVIERLEDEIRIADAAAGNSKVQLAIVGDSVDAWGEKRYRTFSPNEAVDNIKFLFKRDENWEKGDTYTWHMKVFNRRSPISMVMGVDYTDGTSEYVTQIVSTDGWTTLTLPTDTIRTAKYVYGNMLMSPAKGENAVVDSITLVRTRINPSAYDKSLIKFYDNGREKLGGPKEIRYNRSAAPATKSVKDERLVPQGTEQLKLDSQK